MKKQSFCDILKMIRNSCNIAFYTGYTDIRGVCVEAATKIYIEQMRIEAYGPTGYSEQYEAQEDLDNE